MAGHLDVCTVSRVSGWAVSGDQPADLDIAVNDVHVARIHCDRPRPDLEAERLPGNAGFAFVFPHPLAPSDEVSVRFPDGTHLRGSPQSPRRHEGRIAVCSLLRVTGQAMWDGRPAELDIMVNDVPVGRIQRDQPPPARGDQPMLPDGRFEFVFPDRIAPSDVVAVTFTDGSHLIGSPKHPAERDGHLDRCTVAGVRGWAIDQTPQATLDIFVNEVRFASISCSIRRLDLGSQGLAGFAYQFPHPLAASDEVSVRWPNGADLLNSPRRPVQTPLPHPAASPPRQITIVVGMHRSGTSLCSNVLSTLGLDMSDDVQVSPSNARGHWERKEIVAFHDRILRTFNRDWYDGPHALGFPPQWWTLPEVRGIRDEMVKWLRERQHVSRFGFKDPRTARLLPLWEEICAELNLTPRYIFCVRDPAQVARSLARRDGMATREAEYRWMVYNSHAVQGLGQRPLCIVPYEQWFSEQGENFTRLAACLGLDDAPGRLSIREIAAQAIEPGLRHDNEATAGDVAGTLANALYGHIVASAAGNRLTGAAVDAAAAFIAFEDFVQPLLLERTSPGSSVPAAPAAAAALATSITRFAAPQMALAEGLANTIARYSDALKALLRELAQQGGDRDGAGR